MKTSIKNLGFVLLVLFLASCGKGQGGGLFQLEFSKTELCTSKTRTVTFSSGNEKAPRHILGIAIEPGSDPDANFRINSLEVTQTGEVIPAVAGKLEDISIPVGSGFKITSTFSPRRADSASQALLTITIDQPSEAVYQVLLHGEVGEGEGCAFASLGGPVNYDGEQTLQITRLIGVSQKIVNDPLTTDLDQVAYPFIPVDLGLVFNFGAEEVLFPPITRENNFLLPPSLNSNISNLIADDTLIFSEDSHLGTYDAATGEIVIEDMIITMEEVSGAFKTDLAITLTTGALPLSVKFPADKLYKAGMNVFGKELVGQQVWPDDGSEKSKTIILVGIGSIGEVTGNSLQLKTSLANTQMAVQIEAQIVSPSQ